MLGSVDFFKKHTYAKNILTLITGTGLAQLIPIIISPILTRIFSPEDFGVFALYMAYSSIISIFVTGRYELAILLPKIDRDALHVMILSICLSIFLSFILLLLIFVFYLPISDFLKNENFLNFLFLIPFSAMLIGIYQSFNYWLNRKGAYKILSYNKIIQSGGTTATQFFFGRISQNSLGLVGGQFFGQIAATILLAKHIWKTENTLFKKFSKKRLILLAKRYINFPKFLIFAHGFNTASGQIPIFFLSTLFNFTTAGFYTLTQRVLGSPMGLIANAIGDVFRQEASSEFNKNNNCRILYINTFKRLLYFSFLPFLIFFIFAPYLFLFVFGEQWWVAGEYARILTPMFFFQFITSPLSAMFVIAEKQKLDLIWQFFLVISTSASFIFGHFFGDIVWALILFSICYSIMYIINGFMSYRFACNYIKHGAN